MSSLPMTMPDSSNLLNITQLMAGLNPASSFSSILGSPYLQAGLGAAAGAFPTNQSGNSSSSSSTDSNLTSLSHLLATLNGTQQQTVSPEIQDLIAKAAGVSGNQLSQAGNLQPYLAQQTEGINQQAQAQSQAVNNIMAARGLSTSPVSATSAANIENQRQGQITNLNESLPLLQSQLVQQALSGANATAATAPRGTTTSQTQSQQGSNNQSGNNTTNANTSSSQSSGGGIGGLVGGLGSMLAALF